MIGIFGGSFDPIHLGHTHVATQVQSSLDLDTIHFMPCAIPVHRETLRVSDTFRAKMVDLAIAGHNKFRLNTLELDRGGMSYTIDSLRQIRQQHLTDSICLILGVDAFNQFAGWKSPDEILRLAHLVVCQRPGVELDRSIYFEHRVDSAQALRDNTRGLILPLEIKENSCSSTRVRQQLLERGSIPSCLSPAVFEFIVSNHLYEKSD